MRFLKLSRRPGVLSGILGSGSHVRQSFRSHVICNHLKMLWRILCCVCDRVFNGKVVDVPIWSIRLLPIWSAQFRIHLVRLFMYCLLDLFRIFIHRNYGIGQGARYRCYRPENGIAGSFVNIPVSVLDSAKRQQS